MNWYNKTASNEQLFSSMKMHPRIDLLNLFAQADDKTEGTDHLSLNIVPYIAKGTDNGYLLIERNSTMKGKGPKSLVLQSLEAALLREASNRHLVAKIFDDHYEPLEAELLTTGPAKIHTSTILITVGPMKDLDLQEAIKQLSASWRQLSENLINNNMLEYSMIQDAKYRTIWSTTSNSVKEKERDLMNRDIRNTSIVMCRLALIERAHPDIKQWVNETSDFLETLLRYITNHEEKAHVHPQGMCKEIVDKSWIESIDIDGIHRIIFNYACGIGIREFDTVHKVMALVPSDMPPHLLKELFHNIESGLTDRLESELMSAKRTGKLRNKMFGEYWFRSIAKLYSPLAAELAEEIYNLMNEPPEYRATD